MAQRVCETDGRELIAAGLKLIVVVGNVIPRVGQGALGVGLSGGCGLVHFGSGAQLFGEVRVGAYLKGGS